MADEYIIGMAFLLGIYFFYKLAKSFSQPSREYKDELKDIINSDKYKVKGKWEE